MLMEYLATNLSESEFINRIWCIIYETNAVKNVKCMAPPKDHAVGDLLIVAKLEFIWFICCILMEN